MSLDDSVGEMGSPAKTYWHSGAWSCAGALLYPRRSSYSVCVSVNAMRLVNVEHPALASTLEELVRKHDNNQKPESHFRMHQHLQDFATIRAAPSTLHLQSSNEEIIVTWTLSGGLFLDEDGVSRTQTVIAWISKLRFWVLSATLNQTFNVWILTPEQTMKARQHNVYSKMFVVTEPLPECMNVYLPLASNGRDKAMCQHIYEALAAQPASGAPERTILNTSNLPTVLESFPEACAQATAGFMRLVITRKNCSGDSTTLSKLLDAILEFVILFPDLISRWLIRNKMLLKHSMRKQLDYMRTTLERSSQRDCERIGGGHPL